MRRSRRRPHSSATCRVCLRARRSLLEQPLREPGHDRPPRAAGPTSPAPRLRRRRRRIVSLTGPAGRPSLCNAPTQVELHWVTRHANVGHAADQRRTGVRDATPAASSDELVPLACDGNAADLSRSPRVPRTADRHQVADDHASASRTRASGPSRSSSVRRSSVRAAFFAAFAARFFSRISATRSNVSTSAIDGPVGRDLFPTRRPHAEPLAEHADEDPRLVLAEARAAPGPGRAARRRSLAPVQTASARPS